MTNGSDFVTQRQQKTVEQIRLKNQHEEKMLRMRIGENGGIETKKQYELKMLKKDRLKVQRDLEDLRLRAARTIHWSQILQQTSYSAPGGSGTDQPEQEDDQPNDERKPDRPKSAVKVKIRMKSRRLARMHHKCKKDLKKAQEETSVFLQNIHTREKTDVFRELDDMFRPKTPSTLQLIEAKKQRELDLRHSVRNRPFNNAHSKKRFKELTLAEIDIDSIREKITHRLEREKTMDASYDRGDGATYTPLLGDGHFVPQVAIDFTKIRKPKPPKKKYMDILDYASQIGKDKWPKKQKSKERDGDPTSAHAPDDPGTRRPEVVHDPSAVELLSDDDEESSYIGKLERMKSIDFNADGSMRTMHTLPDFNTAFNEAKKARYLRKKDSLMNDRSLDMDAIFGRKAENVITEEEEEEEEETSPRSDSERQLSEFSGDESQTGSEQD